MSGELTGEKWLKLEAEYRISCGITERHRLYCWGSDSFGRLGNGPKSIVAKKLPQLIEIPNAFEKEYWVDIGISYAMCGITSMGRMFCWGSDEYGKLGNGPKLTETVHSPTLITD